MKITIAVLFGGKSVEHEVSIISGIQAIQNMDRTKYDIIPVYITKNNTFYVGDSVGDINAYRNIPRLLTKSQRVVFVNDGGRGHIVRYPSSFWRGDVLASFDVAFPIAHGTDVEDGALQGLLKFMGVPFVGCDVLASAVGMDKFVQKILLKQAGIPVLDALCFTEQEYKNPSKVYENIEQQIAYPVIVKPVNLGSSVGIATAKNAEELQVALDDVFALTDRALIEPQITPLHEINCSVLGDRDEVLASVCEEPVAGEEILTYQDKYMSGAKGKSSKGMATLDRKIPADISDDVREKIQEYARQAFLALGFNGVVRIDFLMNAETGQVWLNEANTIPGSLSFYLWEPVGIPYSELLDRLIQLALKRGRQQDEHVYSFETNLLAMNAKGFKGGKKG